MNIGDLPIFKTLGLSNIDPAKEAFIFVNTDGSDEIVTNLDLYENANRVTRSLLANGIGKGNTFSIIMRNHPEFLYALFGAFTIGAVAVPIDPRSKGSKLAFQIKNSNSKGIIVSGEFLNNIMAISDDIRDIPVIGVVYKDHHGIEVSSDYPNMNERLINEKPDLPDKVVDLDLKGPYQIIYTSGTTGDPKGVVLKGDRYIAYGMLGGIWGYQKDDIPYTGLSMTHGNAQAVTVFPSLASGIKAVIAERFTKSKIWDICRKYGCTTFSLLGGMMMGIYSEPRRPNDDDNPVRMVISAGTPSAIWKEFEERFNVKIFEWYAAVEGGFACNPPGVGPIGSFGKPPEGIYEMKVVQENDEACKPGEIGELIFRPVSGKAEVEYHRNKKASEEKTRGGWQRSGDMCHTDEVGWFYFDYRKGGGLRRQGDFIQPEYVEKVFGEQPEITDVCVYGIPAESGAPGESDIVAAIVPIGGKEIDPKKLFRVVSSSLERNAIPSYLQVVDEIPKSASEKNLDRILRDEFRKDAPNVFRYSD
jgi:crotonobetaine/carnitine-CoA ligase